MARKAKPVRLGSKRICPKCKTKFYDFEKMPVVCPKCKAPCGELSEFKPPAKEPVREKLTRPRSPLLDEVALDPDVATFEDLSDLGDDDRIVAGINLGTNREAETSY